MRLQAIDRVAPMAAGTAIGRVSAAHRGARRTSGAGAPARCRLMMLALALAVSSCGGGSADDSTGDTAAVGTLAYAVTSCRQDNAGYVQQQSMRVRRGERAAVQVMTVPDLVTARQAAGVCRY